jgi:hypothetical protein
MPNNNIFILLYIQIAAEISGIISSDSLSIAGKKSEPMVLKNDCPYRP